LGYLGSQLQLGMIELLMLNLKEFQGNFLRGISSSLRSPSYYLTMMQ